MTAPRDSPQPALVLPDRRPLRRVVRLASWSLVALAVTIAIFAPAAAAEHSRVSAGRPRVALAVVVVQLVGLGVLMVIAFVYALLDPGWMSELGAGLALVVAGPPVVALSAALGAVLKREAWGFWVSLRHGCSDRSIFGLIRVRSRGQFLA